MWQRIFIMMLTVFCFANSGAEAVGLEAAIGGWQQSISGKFSYKGVLESDVLNLSNELQFDDETRLAGRVKIDMPLILPNIYVVGAPAEFDGVSSRAFDLNFGDTDFVGNSQLTSKLMINQYDIGLYYGVPFVGTATLGKFNVDVGLNIRVLDLDAQITGLARVNGAPGTFITQESKSTRVLVPMLYLAGQFSPTEKVAIEAEGRGISFGDDKFYSITTRLRYKLSGPLFVAGGYRYDKVDVDEDDVDGEVELQGLFLEMGLKF